MKAILSSFLILLTIGLSTASAQSSPPQNNQDTEAEAKLSADVARLYNDGKYDEALPLAKRLLTIREKLVGPDKLVVASALNTIGSIYIKKEKYSDAASFFERSLKITETIHGADHLSVGMILDRLALINFVGGNYDKTEEQYNRALAIREKLLGPTNIEVLNSLARLADFYQLRRDFKKAETNLQRILAVKEGASESSGSGLAETYYQYACLKRKMNEPGEADMMEVRAGTLLNSYGIGVPGVLPKDIGIVNGKALELPKPSYPAEAKKGFQAGKVNVRVLINEQGKVIRACAITGPSVFWRATEAVAYRSTFSPTTVEGKPVKVSGIITYKFVAF